MDPEDFKTLKRGLKFPIEVWDLEVTGQAANCRVFHQEGRKKGGLGIKSKFKELEGAKREGRFSLSVLRNFLTGAPWQHSFPPDPNFHRTYSPSVSKNSQTLDSCGWRVNLYAGPAGARPRLLEESNARITVVSRIAWQENIPAYP